MSILLGKCHTCVGRDSLELIKLLTCCIHSMKYLRPLRQEETLYFVSTSNTFFRKNAESSLGGHTNTERGYLPVLARKLQAELAAHQGDEEYSISADIHISQEDKHPLDFV